jgi:hypothetical protein
MRIAFTDHIASCLAASILTQGQPDQIRSRRRALGARAPRDGLSVLSPIVDRTKCWRRPPDLGAGDGETGGSASGLDIGS